MELTNIITLLKASATVVNPTGFFMFGPPVAQNVDSANKGTNLNAPPKPYPHIYSDLQSESGDIKNGFGELTFVLLFLEQDSADSNPDDRDANAVDQSKIISDMRKLGWEFIQHFYDENDDLSLGEAISATPERRRYIGLGTGYAIQFTIKDTSPCV